MIGRASWRGGARRLAAVPRPLVEPARDPAVTCRLEAMPSVKHRPGRAIVIIVNGRPLRQHRGDSAGRRQTDRRQDGERRAPPEPQHRQEHERRDDDRRRDQEQEVAPGQPIEIGVDDGRAGHAPTRRPPDGCRGTRLTSATSRWRTVPGVEGPVCSLIRSENDVWRLRMDQEVAGERMAQQRVAQRGPLAARRARRRTDPGRRAAAPRGWSAR